MEEDFSIIPRLDALTGIIGATYHRAGRTSREDVQLAPLFAEKLRYSYAKVLEIQYPDLMAAEGNVLPIDTAPDPAAIEWEYYVVDKRGVAQWIDDDGQVMGNSALSMSRHTGTMHEMGHAWTLNLFDQERYAKAQVIPVAQTKVAVARRSHEEKTNWTWLFGDPEKQLVGLCNHPNISAILAPAGVGGRRLDQKTNDEIISDVSLLINTIPRVTNLQHRASTVLMSFEHWQEITSRRLDQVTGFANLMDYLQARFAGDASGQGKVEFKILRECKESWRSNPETRTDTSGITGDFMLAMPAPNKDLWSFIQARPFTQRPPQETDFQLKHLTHSKIGGCKLVEPLAIARIQFGPNP